MKNLKIFIIILCLLIPGVLSSKSFIVEVKAGYFNPSDDMFKDIYGGNTSIGAELALLLNDWLGVWVDFRTFNNDGKLTYTGEDTEIKLTAISFGAKYILKVGKKFDFYGGLGLEHNKFNEKNVLGEVDESKTGILLKLGSYFKISKHFFADIFINYSTCKMKPMNFEFNVGGLYYGLGLGYIFK